MILNFIYNSPVGAMKNENEFIGNVSNKTGSSYMISVLMMMMLESAVSILHIQVKKENLK